MFRNNLLGSLLVLLLLVFGLLSCLWAVRYYFSVVEAQRLQGQYQKLQATMAGMQSLVNETIEYSRRNPDVDPLLFQYNLKPRAGTNVPPNTPGTPRPR